MRVYLDRSWFSSGDDETLGVVVKVGPKPGAVWLPERQKAMRTRYQSQWARDPAVTSGPAAPTLELSNFSLATVTADGLSLAEEADGVATVAGHAVAYDQERKLWYCDIFIETTNGYNPYWPFVRLSLLRYQPYSILNAHLSRTVLADFAQLDADRTVSIVPTAGKPPSLTVSLAGVMAHVRGAETPYRKVEVMVERREGTASELGWVPVGIKPVSLLPSPWGLPIFSGQVQIPAASGKQQYRLSIKEYERLVADGTNRSLEPDSPKGVWRLTFADMVEL